MVSYMEARLGIEHIVGTTYHPQSQAMVERMHRDLNGLVTSLVEGSPQDWEDKVPIAQFVLRILPREVLGGRSPYVVVTGLGTCIT